MVVCAAAFAAVHLEQRQEQIANSGETVLEIDPDSVQSLDWTYQEQTLSFHRDEEWIYDTDEAFPVDEQAIAQLLEQFRAFSAAFVITEVEDYGQYGLDDPTCTINLTTTEQSYEILLGDYSAMDSQRYVSIGDGNVYLAVTDPLDAFDVELKDLICNDETPQPDQVTQLTFEGGEEDYTIFYQEDGPSYSSQDVYFTQRDGEIRPLDTDLVEGYLDSIRYLGLTDYVTYNITEEQLQQYGLDEPELTVTMDYTLQNEDGEEVSDTFILHLSRDPEEQAALEESEDETEEDGEEITAYVRVDQSPIVYQISGEDYTALMAATYDDLRHRQVLWADFQDVTQIDVSLEGENYTIAVQGEEEEHTYTYQERELEIEPFQTALEALEAERFTQEEPTQQEEISLIVYLDSEAFPQVEIQLYRYDGTYCLAVVDGQPVSLVPRTQVVELTEAVRGLVWE